MNDVWAERKEKWSQRAKKRTKAEIKEAVLNVLKANKGRVISSEELHKLLPLRIEEVDAFKAAFDELVSEGKIKQYIGLP